MLSVYMIAVAVNQLLWITFAPITHDATLYYGVSDILIGILSMSFMIVFIIVSIPASWIIDKYGIKIGVGTGVILTGVFGLLRGLVTDNYTLLLLSQIGIAIGQPFLLNAITKVAARWFPPDERATASGLGTLAMYVGILTGMILTPYLVKGSGIGNMLYIYGVMSVIAGLIFFLFAREHPAKEFADQEGDERVLALDGMKQMLNNKSFILLAIIFFMGLGIFNSVTTWIENIVGPRGFTAVQAGIIGGTMIAGGILGAFIMPIFSDHRRKRVPFIIIALAGATLCLAGITFVTDYSLLIASGIGFGFFLLSSGPIGFQYGAEITYPVSEGTSNGFLLLAGQISGIAMIFGMDSFKSVETGSMTRPLVVMIICLAAGLLLSTRLKESAIFSATKECEK
jgi:cyanate permease